MQEKWILLHLRIFCKYLLLNQYLSYISSICSVQRHPTLVSYSQRSLAACVRVVYLAVSIFHAVDQIYRVCQKRQYCMVAFQWKAMCSTDMLCLLPYCYVQVTSGDLIFPFVLNSVILISHCRWSWILVISCQHFAKENAITSKGLYVKVEAVLKFFQTAAILEVNLTTIWLVCDFH